MRDYRRVAPRYGTNEDLCALFAEAHARDMHVLLDLVPGHTSEEHAWFKESGSAQKNSLSGRYIWTDGWFADSAGLPCIRGECPRDGGYIVNFFKCQPALNYGFLHPEAPWQQAPDAPDALSTREAVKDIMRFWLSRGCDGFRVDMADSLVKKDDAAKSGTSAVWRDIRAMLDREYPEAVLVSEWGIPEQALPAGFDADFYLDWQGNGYNSLLRDYERGAGKDRSYFKKDAGGSIRRFLDEYLPRYARTRNHGYISLITGNHDTIRISHNLSQRELELAFAVLFTLPGVPFLYYGDEIGMRYLPLPTKEGGYHRTGSRSPMQWGGGANLGFSAARPEDLYLPVDPAPDAPTVAAQEADPASLLHTVRAILGLRRGHDALRADGPLEILCGEPDRPFVYRRGGLVLAVNPDGQARTVPLAPAAPLPGSPEGAAEASGTVLFQIGDAGWADGALSLGPQSFAAVGLSGDV